MKPSNPKDLRWTRTSTLLGQSALALVLIACASGAPKQKEPAAPSSPEAHSRAAGAHAAGPWPGSSLDRPMLVCGPQESYRYVAKEFQCPRGGGNPLAGDLERARDARLGALDHPDNGHIVDVYRVPCSEGEVELFVDMYGCEEYEQQLSDKTPSPSLEALMENYDDEDYEAVIKQCDRAPTELEADESMYCMVLVPASFFVAGKASLAVGVLRELCNRLPAPSSLSDARANLVVQVTTAVARTAEKRGADLGTEEGAEIVAVFAEACQVTPHDLERALQNTQTL